MVIILISTITAMAQVFMLIGKKSSKYDLKSLKNIFNLNFLCLIKNLILGGIMKKITTISLLSVTFVTIPTLASRFGEGFGIGAFTGLATGLITSKIAERHHYYPPAVTFVHPPVKRRIQMHHNHYLPSYQKEKRENYLKEYELKHNRKQIIKSKQIQEKELALREKEIELALIKEKKELLAQENKKKELELKEKELNLSKIS